MTLPTDFLSSFLTALDSHWGSIPLPTLCTRTVPEDTLSASLLLSPCVPVALSAIRMLISPTSLLCPELSPELQGPAVFPILRVL